MARENENIARNAEQTAQSQDTAAFDTGQQEIGQFNQNLGTLERGGNVAANPWKSAGYLSNVNRLQSEALNSATNAGTNELQTANRRTGGLNTGATIGATKDLALSKMRLGDQLSAERGANDFNKNVGYQTNIAEAPLRSASAETGYYGPAAGLVGSTNKTLEDYTSASYGPYLAALNAAGQLGSAAIKGAFQPTSGQPTQG